MNAVGSAFPEENWRVNREQEALVPLAQAS